MDDLNKRLNEVEKNLAIFAAGEAQAAKWRDRVDRALFGKNGDKGMVDHVSDLKEFKDKFVKVLIWITALIIAPLLATIGFLTIKILAHIDKIMKLLDNLH